MKSETRDLNGNPYFIRTWGDASKPPLLMLHGFPEYGGAWAELAELLQDGFHCIAPDLRGFGQSYAPDDISRYAISDMLADMVAIHDGPVTVLGHDWGSALAYGLAMFKPDFVDRLIIMNGVHPVPFQREMAKGGAQSEASQYINVLRATGSEDRLSANDFDKLLKLFSANMDLSWLTPEKLSDYKTEWGRDGRLKTMIHWYRASPLIVADPGKPVIDIPTFPPERLQVRCPHLLIWGTQDTALLPAAAEGLEDFAPQLTRVTLDNADHWLHHQQPEAVAHAILSWTTD
jgi:pimeloyl-ACP methyl ester carboxylesterase